MNDDLSLIRNDTRLAALATLLDGERIGALLRSAGHEVDAARVAYVRYKPHTSAVAGVFVSDGRGETRAVHAAAYPVAAHDKLDKLRRRPDLVLADDREHGLVLALDEADRHLPGIREARRRHPDLDAVVYKPGRRWVGISHSDGVVVKVHTLDAARAAVAAYERVAPHLPTARLVAVDETLGIVTTALIEGLPLDDLRGQNAGTRAATEAGRALARLHAVDAGTAPSRAASSYDDASDAARAVGALAPDLASRAERIARASCRAIAALPRPTRTLVHGDFSADQVVVASNGTAHIIDLDRAHHGDPLDDLACWAADALARHDEDGSDGLLAGYRAAGGRVDRAALAPRVAVALLRRAVEPFRLRIPGWRAHVERILAHAERLLVDPELPGLAPTLTEPGAEVIVHRRGRRAVVRVPRPDGDVYIKAVRPKRFAGVASRALHVTEMTEARMPEIVSADAGLAVIRQRSVGERTLLEVGSDPSSSADLVAAAWRQTARVVAELQTMTVAGLDEHGPAEELGATRKAVEAAVTAGAIADPSSRLRAVEDALEALGDRPRVLAHRDLHDKQLLLPHDATPADPRLGLIDVDTLAAADPALDVANLLVHIELREAQSLLAPETARTVRTAFAEALRRDERLTAATWSAIPAYQMATRLRLAAVYALRHGEGRAAEAMWRSAAGTVNTMVR